MCFVCSLDLAEFEKDEAFLHGFVMCAVHGPDAIESIRQGICDKHAAMVNDDFAAATMSLAELAADGQPSS